MGAHPSAQLGVVMCNANMEQGDLNEALAHALMLVAQRPSHALGLNMAGMLILDLTGTRHFDIVEVLGTHSI